MSDFLVGQSDYVNFVYGLAFFLLAGTARALASNGRAALPWKWLAGFALARAVSVWLDVASLSFERPSVLEIPSFLFLAVSSVLLLEFARRAAGRRGRRLPVLVLGLPVVVSLAGGLSGWEGLNASVRYALGVPSAAWAGWELWRASRSRGAGAGSLRVAALAMALLGVASGVIVGRAPFFPASVVNAEAFLALTGLSVHVARAAVAAVLALGAWRLFCVLEREASASGAKTWVHYERGLTVALLLLLAGGWVTTETASQSGAADQRQQLRLRTTAAASLLPESLSPEATGQALQSLVASQPDVRSASIVGLHGESLHYIANVVSDAYPVSSAAIRPGDAYRYAGDAVLDLVRHAAGRAAVTEVPREGTILAGLAPIRSRSTGEVLGVLDLEVDFLGTQLRAHRRVVPILVTLFGAILLVAFFVSERRVNESSAALERSDRLTHAILASSARFVGLRLEEVDEAIRSALREVGTFLEVDRTQLVRLSDDGQSFSISHEWCAPGVPHRLLDLQQVERAQYPWVWGTIEATGFAASDDVNLLPVEAAREREALRAQGVKAFACVAVHRHGQPVGFLGLDVLSRGRSWPDDEIGLLRVVGDVLSNALARKQAEEALRDSEQRFVKAFRNSPAPMLIVRARDERTTEVNDGFLRVFDVGASEVLGRTLDQLHLFAAADDLSTVRDFLSRGLPLRDFEVTLRAGGGETRHGLLSVDLFEAGGETFYLVVTSDLTERRRAEEALREREEIFRSISAAAQDAIVMVDPAGLVTVWNEAAEQMFGYAREEAVGRLVHDLIVPERYEARSFLGLAQFRESGRGPLIGSPQQVVARRSDGRELPVELSMSAIQLRGGWHAVAIIRDITERMKVDEALWNAKEQAEAANLELQRSVERANRLAQEAAVANATKSEFLANMSHEIRTPMNGIIGMSGLLLDTPLGPEQREYAETVRSCADSLLTIINDILDFSKIEAGRLDLEMLDFDLAVTLEELSDILAVRAHEKGLELTCLVAPAVPTLLCGDPGRLRQVLTNLAGNAIKFTEAGEVGIEVQVEEERADQVVLRFLVKDTGIGIPADKQDMLFQPFTQVDSSMTRRFGGTGLGLSISRQLAQLMGGRIGVESEVGRGSTFWFTARFSRQARQPAAPPTAAIEGIRVLGADDNATNRRVLAGLLEAWGCRYELAEDGEKAIARLREAAAAGDAFRVAILDMVMPSLAGDEVGRLVKADPALRDTILVMMTSAGRRGEVSRLANLGFSGYLAKPVKGSHLYETLRMLVGRMSSDDRVQSRRMVTRFTVAEAARRRTRILLAEDNITNQRVARAVLEKMGHRVDAVANGAEALRALGSMPYDLVLMDVQMPEMDGFEATRAIRNAGTAVRNPGVPIIAMTAHAMKGDRERCLAAGMDDYVSKPIRPEELAEAIARWMSVENKAPGARGDVVEGEPVENTPAEPVGQAPDATGQATREVMGQNAPPGVVAPAPDGSLLDREGLLDRLGGDETILVEIVKVFLEDAPRQIEAMEAAGAAGDAVTLRRLAHSMKGSAGTVGAVGLQAAALTLERAVTDGDLASAQQFIPPVREHFGLVETAMAGWLVREDPA